MPGKSKAAGQNPIDRLMERASAALEATRYFEAQRLAAGALARAHSANDFERMSRILLPLQEARRQIRQLAVDSGQTFLVSGLARIQPMIGCYLFQPPLIGADARAFRDSAASEEVPVFVITREPLTRDGRWPIVAVNGSVSVRTRVEPPWKLERVETNVSKDAVGAGAYGPPPVAWFESASEALGDAAIARLKEGEPAAWRVDDLMGYLDCHPDHEKLHQRLADECRRAMTEPIPEGRRHRPMMDDSFSF